jgi:PKD repeat protein
MIKTKSTNFFLQGKRLLILTSILFWVGSVFAQSTNCKSDFRFEIDQNTKTISIKAKSSHSPAVFGFKLGDGTFIRGEKISHTYAAAGDYEICLSTIAFDSSTNQRCTTKVCKDITIVDCDKLKANFRYVVDGMTVKLVGETNSKNVSTGFRFGDGQGERKDEVKHTYARPGTYEVCYIAEDLTYGCRKEVCKKIIISAPCDLKANFNVRQDDNAAKFIAESSAKSARYLWSFGDGTRGSGAEVKHDYDKAGDFQVCLVVYALNSTNDQICTTKVCKKITVEDDNDCKLRAKFEYRQDGNQFKFIAKANQNPAKFEWNFGDGSDATGSEVRHEYDKPGTYKVCVTVYTRSDVPGEVCKTRYCQKVVVKRPDCNLKAHFAVEKYG